MEISPRLGLGDLLILKCYTLNSTDISKIIINNHIVNKYRVNPERYTAFLQYYIDALFKGVSIENEENPELYNIQSYSDIKSIYLYDHYSFKYPKVLEYSDYIVIHTKVRFDYYISSFLDNDYPKLIDFIKKFKTSKTIILLGERTVEQNLEVKIHNIISIYKDLLQLRNNNKLMDLTKDESIYSGSEIESFEKDIHIINGADYNITLGYGGNYCLPQCFNKNTISYIGGLNERGFEMFKRNNPEHYHNIDFFMEKLKTIT